MPPPNRRMQAACALLVLVAAPVAAAKDVPSRLRPPAAARAVVDAVNAVVQADISIAAAESAACTIDRLPATLDHLLPLVPHRHRQLIGECARGEVRAKRRMEGFDPLRMVDDRDEAGPGPEGRRIAAYFAGRAVDVVMGTGLSEGPYPLAFDWAVVLDPRSKTIFSFVLNCRD